MLLPPLILNAIFPFLDRETSLNFLCASHAVTDAITQKSLLIVSLKHLLTSPDVPLDENLISQPTIFKRPFKMYEIAQLYEKLGGPVAWDSVAVVALEERCLESFKYFYDRDPEAVAKRITERVPHARSSVIHTAAARGYLEVIRYLWEEKGLTSIFHNVLAGTGRPEEVGYPTMLACALAERQFEVVRYLVTKCDVDWGDYPFAYAASHPLVMADRDSRNWKQETVALVKELEEYGLDLSDPHEAFFHSAAVSGSLPVLEYAVSKGARVPLSALEFSANIDHIMAQVRTHGVSLDCISLTQPECEELFLWLGLTVYDSVPKRKSDQVAYWRKIVAAAVRFQYIRVLNRVPNVKRRFQENLAALVESACRVPKEVGDKTRSLRYMRDDVGIDLTPHMQLISRVAVEEDWPEGVALAEELGDSWFANISTREAKLRNFVAWGSVLCLDYMKKKRGVDLRQNKDALLIQAAKGKTHGANRTFSWLYRTQSVDLRAYDDQAFIAACSNRHGVYAANYMMIVLGEEECQTLLRTQNDAPMRAALRSQSDQAVQLLHAHGVPITFTPADQKAAGSNTRMSLLLAECGNKGINCGQEWKYHLYRQKSPGINDWDNKPTEWEPYGRLRECEVTPEQLEKSRKAYLKLGDGAAAMAGAFMFGVGPDGQAFYNHIMGSMMGSMMGPMDDLE
ncbi:hypothetical protein HDU87_006110 [Geranomyces variabilis]|uniref:Ankyrin repeat protein n=1 Tax=Geranomyces variabilis TaxID=109894 RepID=A0AAD5XPB0_9FUNG|nr:hypothetical protein HDU87_006110 [Geranomyces variabilis]